MINGDWRQRVTVVLHCVHGDRQRLLQIYRTQNGRRSSRGLDPLRELPVQKHLRGTKKQNKNSKSNFVFNIRRIKRERNRTHYKNKRKIKIATDIYLYVIRTVSMYGCHLELYRIRLQKRRYKIESKDNVRLLYEYYLYDVFDSNFKSL